MSASTPVVFVIDDDVSIRESLAALLDYEGWRPVVLASAEEFLARPRVAAPSCLILDLALPGLNGLDLQKIVAADLTYMPIIFITGAGDVPTTVKAMKAGAIEFLTKPFSDDALLAAIRDAMELSSTILHRDAAMRLIQLRYASLSAREREVFDLAVSGLLNKQIAGKLGISEITVKAHRGKVMRKMEAGSFAELVNFSTSLRSRISGSA